MPREVLLVLLQNREKFLQLLVIDGVDVAGGLVEVAGEAGGVVGEEGAGAGDFGVDLGDLLVNVQGECGYERWYVRGGVCCWLACIL